MGVPVPRILFVPQGDAASRASIRAVAEYKKMTSPRMHVCDCNVAGVAWSKLKPGINTNERMAITYDFLSIDVVNVSAGVDEALVAL